MSTAITTAKAAAAFLALWMATVPGVYAQTFAQKYDLSVKRVFSENQTTGGFFTAENIAADCLWGLVYIDLAQPAGRSQMALLITAKAQGLRIQRLDYKKDVPGYPAGACVASGIHIE